LDVRCNSEHPDVARVALKQWSDEIIRTCGEALPFPRTKKGKK
jgi:hypothetical protein